MFLLGGSLIVFFFSERISGLLPLLGVAIFTVLMDSSPDSSVYDLPLTYYVKSIICDYLPIHLCLYQFWESIFLSATMWLMIIFSPSFKCHSMVSWLWDHWPGNILLLGSFHVVWYCSLTSFFINFCLLFFYSLMVKDNKPTIYSWKRKLRKKKKSKNGLFFI